jgi:DNA polymerase sigma
LRFYTEQFNYDEHVVTIRQTEPLLKHEKGWFRQTIAIEDPFELSHNLAGGLSPRSILINWLFRFSILFSRLDHYSKSFYSCSSTIRCSKTRYQYSKTRYEQYRSKFSYEKEKENFLF